MAASIEYGIQYTINKVLNYSILNEPMELIGLIILSITAVIVIAMINYLNKSYKETKAVETLLFYVAIILLLAALVTLTLEKFSYSTLGLPKLGDILAWVAFIPSGAAVVCADAFSFRTTFPNHVRIFTSFVILLVAIYISVLTWAINQGPPVSNVIDFEVVYSQLITLIVYATLIPIVMIGPVIFFYFAYKVRSENKPNSNRSFWFGLGFTCFALGYVNEVSPAFPVELAAPFRLFFLASAILFYTCFKMPSWFKKRTGWTE